MKLGRSGIGAGRDGVGGERLSGMEGERERERGGRGEGGRKCKRINVCC